MPRERPLSPHLLVYKPQLTSVLSISHRLSGAALAGGSLLAVWWIVALATGPEYFGFVQALMLSVPGQLVLMAFSAAVFYHLSNGIRHLFWDAGKGYAPGFANVTAWMTIIFAAVATAVVWAYILTSVVEF